MRTLGVSLGFLNLTLWFCVPSIRAFVDSATGRWSNTDNPLIMVGVQELFVYFDPWLARKVFPIVYMAGFALIPFLRAPKERENARGLTEYMALWFRFS